LLRAARFVAKLDVEPDQGTELPIRILAPLLNSVPPARLFEEVCKLFLTGHGLRSMEALQRFGLSASLFPALETANASGQIELGPLLRRALENTDARIREGKSVTPAFLFAALLWQPMKQRSEALIADGMAVYDAYMVAADEVFAAQSRSTAVPRRFSAVSKQIWSLQPRFNKTGGARWKRLMLEQRFRAAYDFLLLRVAEDPGLAEQAAFWTRAQEGLSVPEPDSVDRRPMRRRRPRMRRRGASRS
jgi:poly(A) polymerase